MAKRRVLSFFAVLLIMVAMLLSVQIALFGGPTGYVVLGEDSSLKDIVNKEMDIRTHTTYGIGILVFSIFIGVVLYQIFSSRRYNQSIYQRKIFKLDLS